MSADMPPNTEPTSGGAAGIIGGFFATVIAAVIYDADDPNFRVWTLGTGLVVGFIAFVVANIASSRTSGHAEIVIPNTVAEMFPDSH